MPGGIVHAWHNANSLGENQRAAVTGVFVGLGNLSGIVSSGKENRNPPALAGADVGDSNLPHKLCAKISPNAHSYSYLFGNMHMLHLVPRVMDESRQ